jgi:hypothetical protein
MMEICNKCLHKNVCCHKKEAAARCNCGHFINGESFKNKAVTLSLKGDNTTCSEEIFELSLKLIRYAQESENKFREKEKVANLRKVANILKDLSFDIEEKE